MEPILIVFFRWLHITSATIAVGGVFFLRIVIPIAMRSLDSQTAATFVQRIQRVFKMVVHTCVLLLLVSGSFNAWTNWSKYSAMGKGLGHSLFGTHLLLALIVFGVVLWLLAGREVKKNNLKWLGITLALMLLTIASASVLKYARDTSKPLPMVATQPDPSALP
jgi:uncharacterized membrane protein